MDSAAEFLLTLLHASTNTHLLHWTTKSYAEHQALGKFYSELPELVDQLAEAMMGKFDTTPTFPENYYLPAKTGKEDAFKAAFTATAGTCKSCHDDFRNK